MSRSTRIRKARKAVAAMKRLAFSTGNKKAPGSRQGLSFECDRRPSARPPEATDPHSNARSMNDEICR